jgi:multiple sugar transport system permease protein
MLSTSLMTRIETEEVPINFVPSVPRFLNYVEALRAAPFGRYFFNTVFVSLAVTGCVLVTSILAGYTFGRMKFKGKEIIFGVFMATMMVPFEVILIPNSLIIQRLGLQSTYAALILPWAANVFSIFLLKQFFQSLPQDYHDAAQIDGCSEWQFLWRVAVPMVKPALTTVALFAFLGSWNSLLWPLIVTDETSMRVLQVGLTTFLEEEQAFMNLLMAASAFVTAPVIIIYLFAQRRFIEGVSGVGLKG